MIRPARAKPAHPRGRRQSHTAEPGHGMSPEVMARPRSLSTSQSTPAVAQLAQLKPRGRWRRKTANTPSDSNLAELPRRASECFPSVRVDDEPAVGSDAQGASTDGGQRPPSADYEPSDSSDSHAATMTGEGCDGSEHGGQHVVSIDVPVHIDQLFTMMFTRSDFLVEFYKKLKYYEWSVADWQPAHGGAQKRRVRFKLDVTLGKTSTVTEDQEIMSVSRPGFRYIINSEVNNAGVPMADVFYTTKHYCIHRVSSTKTRLDAWCETKFRKTTLFKGFIEKTAIDGMQDHHSVLQQMLTDWTSEPAQKKRKKRRHPADGEGFDRGTETSRSAADRPLSDDDTYQRRSAGAPPLVRITLALTLLLLALNCYIYLRMSRVGHQIEVLATNSLLASDLRSYSPELLQNWLTSVQRQEESHRTDLARWQQAVLSAAEVVRQSESALASLHETLELSQTDPADRRQQSRHWAPPSRYQVKVT